MLGKERKHEKLSLDQKGAIVALSEFRISIEKIANYIGISRSTVVYWQKRFAESVERKRGSGRPRSTLPIMDYRIYRTALANPFLSAKEIAGNCRYCFELL